VGFRDPELFLREAIQTGLAIDRTVVQLLCALQCHSHIAICNDFLQLATELPIA